MPKRPRPFLIFRKFEILKLCCKLACGIPKEAYWPADQEIVSFEAPRWLNFAQMAKMLKFDEKTIF